VPLKAEVFVLLSSNFEPAWFIFCSWRCVPDAFAGAAPVAPRDAAEAGSCPDGSGTSSG